MRRGIYTGRGPVGPLARLLASCRNLSCPTASSGGYGSADIFTGPDVPALCEALSACTLSMLDLTVDTVYSGRENTTFRDPVAGSATHCSRAL